MKKEVFTFLFIALVTQGILFISMMNSDRMNRFGSVNANKSEERFDFSESSLSPEQIEDIIDSFPYSSLKPAEVKYISQHIHRTARMFNLDPALILAVIAAESSFRHKVRSRKGARGLMQLVPLTARAMTRELNIKWFGRKMLYNPHQNIILGTYYLKKLKRRYKNNPKLFLTAYNMGPTHLNRILRKKKRMPRRLKYYSKVINYYERFSI